MQGITFTLIEVIAAACGGILVSVLISSLILKACLSSLKKQFKAEKKQLDSQLKILTTGSVGLGKKLIALESKFASLKSVQEEMKTSDMEFSFTQAQKMIEQGVDSRAIAESSGLSSSEIQLMQLLHKQSHRDTETESY